jgi:hypothetical protein
LWNIPKRRNVGGHWPTKMLQSRLPTRNSIADAMIEPRAAQYHTSSGTWSVARKYCARASCAVSLALLVSILVAIVSPFNLYCSVYNASTTIVVAYVMETLCNRHLGNVRFSVRGTRYYPQGIAALVLKHAGFCTVYPCASSLVIMGRSMHCSMHRMWRFAIKRATISIITSGYYL